jgi:shikimate kinase
VGKRIVFTGFMGVGKSTVAKCLAHILRCERVDLDIFIEKAEKREIVDIIDQDGQERFREIETFNLKKILLETKIPIISLGGGAWIGEENRQLIKEGNCTSVWLESTFEHCWRNIKNSRTRRPLAKERDIAEKLFDERQKYYCLSDWHLIVKPDLTSYDLAKQIAEEIF